MRVIIEFDTHKCDLVTHECYLNTLRVTLKTKIYMRLPNESELGFD
jgi:hypothetical protein